MTYNSADLLPSVLDWWQRAGVDTVVGDAPRQWLRAAPPPRQGPADTPSAPDAPQSLPDTLEALTAWLARPETIPALGASRLSPIGSAAADLMILTDMPDAEDIAAGGLLSGTAGRLFDAMLGAIGRARETAYLAALAPGRPATGRLDSAQEKELAGIALRHVDLARPKLLLLLGDATTRALAGANLAEKRGTIHALNFADGIVPAIATFHPRFLLQQPARKADAWADLRLVMEKLAS